MSLAHSVCAARGLVYEMHDGADMSQEQQADVNRF